MNWKKFVTTTTTMLLGVIVNANAEVVIATPERVAAQANFNVVVSDGVAFHSASNLGIDGRIESGSLDNDGGAQSSSCLPVVDGLVVLGARGEVVTLCPGTYQLNYGIIVDSPVTLTGDVILIGPAQIAPPGNRPFIGIEILVSDVTVQGITLRDWEYAILGPLNRPTDRIRVAGNTFHNNDRSVVLNGNSYNIQGNTVYSGGGIATESDTVLGGTVRDNLIQTSFPSWSGSSRDRSSVAIDIGGYLTASRGDLIEGNVITHTRNPNDMGLVGGIITRTTEQTTVRNNYIENIFGLSGIALTTNSEHLIENNSIQNIYSVPNYIPGFTAAGIGIKLGEGPGFPVALSSISHNVIYSDAGPNPHTYGIVQRGQLGATLGLGAFFFNVIGSMSKGIVLGSGGISPLETVFVVANYFIGNSLNIDEPGRAAEDLVVFNNFYDDFASSCTPTIDGCCEEPFSWGNSLVRDDAAKHDLFACEQF